MPFSLSASVTLTQGLTTRTSDGLLDFEGTSWVTSVRPSVRLTSRSGRVQGVVDYALNASIRARRLGDQTDTTLRHNLNAQVTADIVPHHLQVEFAGRISGQPASAFGPQFASDPIGEADLASVGSFSVTPTYHTLLAGLAQFRASAVATRTDTSVGGRDSSGYGATVGLSSVGPRRFGWGLDAAHRVSRFSEGREATTDSVIASAFIRPLDELRLSLRVGEEYNNYLTENLEDYPTHGFGVEWRAGVRTTLTIQTDDHWFGRSRSIMFQHRFRRSIIRYSDSTGVNDAFNNGAPALISAYDLFYELFASLEPDPVLREQFVLSFLAQAGISPDAVIAGGFVTGGPTVNSRQELSWSYNAQRTVYVVAAFRSRTRRLGVNNVQIDELSFGPIAQRGLRATVSHRLSSNSSVTAFGEIRRSEREADGRYSTFTNVGASWNTSLSSRSTLSLGVRRSQHDDVASPYVERAVTASFRHSF